MRITWVFAERFGFIGITDLNQFMTFAQT